jgi:tRNA(adenine34) deaminase
MVYPVFSDEYFMNEALKEAKKAFQIGEVPVGAVIIANNLIIARSHNLTHTLNDVTAHAEMQAITSAQNYLGNRYLNECTLYVSLEPCLMCASATFWAQIGKIVYGAADPKAGFLKIGPTVLHPKTLLTGGILAAECAEILKEFFQARRN